MCIKLSYNNEQMLQKLKSITSKIIEKRSDLSGGLTMMINMDLKHQPFNGKFEEKILFNQIFEIELANKEKAFIINTYFFPDIRKAVVQNELEYIIFVLRKIQVNAKILVVGDFNHDLIRRKAKFDFMDMEPPNMD